MAKSPKALVNAEVLKWAREKVSLSPSEAAKKVGTKEHILIAWETGEERPTIKQVRTMAKVYRRTFPTFFLNEIPTTVNTLVTDHRTLSGRPPGVYSYDLARALIDLEANRAGALDMADELGEETRHKVPNTEGGRKTDAHVLRAAKTLREALGVTIEEQFSWEESSWDQSYLVYSKWREAIERLNVLCMQLSVPVDEVRGVSLYEEHMPVIATNSKEAVEGRVFTLAHELVHLSLSSGGICDLDTGDAEVFCNAVAAEILVPRQALKKQPEVKSHHGSRWRMPVYLDLARRFGVSREVIGRRLMDLGLATRDEYGRLRAALKQEREARKKAEKDRKKGYGPANYQLTLPRLGVRYVRMAFELLDRGASESETGNRLGIAPAYLPKVGDKLFAKLFGRADERSSA